MQSKLQWVIFDLGGVIVKLNIDGALRALAQQSETDADVIKTYLSAPDEKGLSINAKMELGWLTAEDYVRQVSQILNKQLSPAEIIALKMLIIQGEDEQMLDLLAALSAQKKLACFSNTHEIHWDHMTQHYRAFQFFEQTVASHLIQAAKPDQKAFALVTKQLGADPQECLFIDDALANAEAARDFGWQAIHFQSHTALREALQPYGIQL